MLNRLGKNIGNTMLLALADDVRLFKAAFCAIGLLMLATLGGCAANTSATAISPAAWATGIGKVKTAFDLLKPDITAAMVASGVSPADVAKVTADETTVDNELSVLASSEPTSAASVLTLMTAFVANLPPGALNPKVQADVQLVTTAATLLEVLFTSDSGDEPRDIDAAYRG